MALDRQLTLLHGLAGESAENLTRGITKELIRISEAPPTHINYPKARLVRVAQETRSGGLALYLPSISTESAASATRRLQAGTENPYEILGSEGILLINPVQDHGAEILLSGGSYCDVTLLDRESGPVIRKSISRIGASNDNDGLRRHKNEARWLGRAHEICSLFPSVEDSGHNLDVFFFETRFVAAYSLGELVFQGRVTGSELADTVIATYESLRSTLYSHRPIPVDWPDKDKDYLEKISRRSDRILSVTRGTKEPVGELLRASRIRVNGRDCPTLETVLRTVRSDMLWRPIIRPARQHACHGDLILEDILLKPGPNPEISLIDPNPYNQNCVHDIAKTMLSLWIGYEFVYFDAFQIAAEIRNGEAWVEIAFTQQECRDRYKIGAARFLEYVRSKLRGLIDTPEETLDRLVCMAAALTALAIPSFHIHHNRPDRALAFLALGLLYASHAMAEGSFSAWSAP